MSRLIVFTCGARNEAMNEEQIKRLKEIVEQSKSFALVLEEGSEDYEFLAREALKAALSEKSAYVYLAPQNEKSFLDKWSAILPKAENNPPYYFVSLGIPKKQFKVKEIFYESNNDFFTLNIGTENTRITPENIVFKPRATAIDAVFCFGSTEIKWPEIMQEETLLPEKEKIIYITNSIEQKTISEKIKDIISIIDEKLLSQNNIPDLLFASLILETNCFSHNFSETNIDLVSSFLKLGADRETINKILEKEKTDSLAQLIGRALARTRIHENLLSSWTFLSKEDLKKTGFKGNNPRFFYQIFLKIKEFLPPQPLSFVFWQKENGIYLLTTTAHESKDDLIFLGEKLSGNFYGKFFVSGPFKNFSEAEIKTREALKEIVQ